MNIQNLPEIIETSYDSEAPFESYLLVEECREGTLYAMRISPQSHLNIEKLVDRFLEHNYCGELKRDGHIIPQIEGDYYASIKTDWNDPSSVTAWDSGGFYAKASYE